MEKIAARKLLLEAQEHIRHQGFVLRRQGYKWMHIAEVCGVHVGTVSKWATWPSPWLGANVDAGSRGAAAFEDYRFESRPASA
jgi:hypothetical protein